MNNDILTKAQNDTAYSQIVQLYSGLFDTQDERETFILDVAEEDILLAAECKTSSVEEEENIKSRLIYEAEKNANQFSNTNNSAKAFLALLEFDEITKIIEILTSVYTAKKEHRNVLKVIIENADTVSKKIDFIYAIIYFIKQKMMQPKQKTMGGNFMYWAIPNFSSNDETLTVNDFSKIKDISSFLESQEQYISLLNLITQLNLLGKLYTQNQVFDILSKLMKKNKFLEIHNQIKKLGFIEVFTPLQAFRLALNVGTTYYIDICIQINELYNLGYSKEDILNNWVTIYNKFVPKKKKRIKEQILKFANKNNIIVYLENDIKSDEPKVTEIFNKNKVSENIVCIILNIISTRVFVKIVGEKRKASISIKELSDKRTSDITQFEYNGEKLHIGQKLITKVLEIDEKET